MLEEAEITRRIQEAEQKVLTKVFAEAQPELAAVVQSLGNVESPPDIDAALLRQLAVVLRKLGNGLDSDKDVNPLFTQAQQVLSESLIRYPADTKLLNEQGNLHYVKVQYDRALAQFENVIRSSPPTDVADTVYALEMAGAAQRELRNFTEAEDLFRQAVALGSGPSVRLLVERGWLRFYQKRYDQAFTDFEAAQGRQEATQEDRDEGMTGQIASRQAEDARNPDDKQDRGRVLMEGWRTAPGGLSNEAAISILEQCDAVHTDLNLYQAALKNSALILHIDSENQNGLCLQIEALTWLRRFKEAEKACEAAQKRFPDNIEIWKKMGQLHNNQKRFREAYLYYSGKAVKELGKSAEAAALLEALQNDEGAREWTIVSLRKMHDLVGAREEVDKALETGDKISFLSERAVIDFTERKYASAIKYFDRALAINGYYEFALQWRAASFRKAPEMVKATSESDQLIPDFSNARTALDAALKKLPFGTGLLEERGWLEFEQGNLKQAGEDFDRATELDPYLIQRRFSRIEAYARLNLWDEALKIFKTLEEQFPNDAEVTEQLCWFYLRMGRHEQAKEKLESLQEHHDGSVLTTNAEGGYELDRGNYSKAERAFRSAIDQVDYEPQYHINLAWALIRQVKEPGEIQSSDLPRRDALLTLAKERCQEALILDPYSAKAYGCLGVIAFKRSSFLDAEAYFRQSIELSPPEGSYVELAALYCQMGRYDDAAAKLKEAVQLKKNDARVYIEWGNVHVLQENNKEAVRLCREAVVAEPTNPDAHRALAIAFMRSEQYDEAESSIRKALKMVAPSGHWPLYLLLSQVLVRLGDLANKYRKKKNLDLYNEALTYVNAAKGCGSQTNADIFFHAGIVHYKLEDYRSSRRNFTACLDANRDRFEAERYNSTLQALIDREKKLFKVNKWYGIVLAVICISLLAALWGAYYRGRTRTILVASAATAPAGTAPPAGAPAAANGAAEAARKREPQDEYVVDKNFLLAMTPILLGLLVVAALLPNLGTLKLPGGFEAVINEPKPEESEISSGPQGEIGFGSSLPVVSPQPR